MRRSLWLSAASRGRTGPHARGRAAAGRPGERRRRDAAGTTERAVASERGWRYAVASERAVAEWRSKWPLALFYGGALTAGLFGGNRIPSDDPAVSLKYRRMNRR